MVLHLHHCSWKLGLAVCLCLNSSSLLHVMWPVPSCLQLLVLLLQAAWAPYHMAHVRVLKASAATE